MTAIIQSTTTDYRAFLERKRQLGAVNGFAPLFLPEFLFDFQQALLDWAVRKGRAALFLDCVATGTLMCWSGFGNLRCSIARPSGHRDRIKAQLFQASPGKPQAITNPNARPGADGFWL